MEYRPTVVRAHEHGYRYWELATGHDAMVTAPQSLATLLIETTLQRTEQPAVRSGLGRNQT